MSELHLHRLVADWLVRDVGEAPDEDTGFLDALGTLTGLTENDLCLVAIELARRLIPPRRISKAGPRTELCPDYCHHYDSPCPPWDDDEPEGGHP